MVRPLEHGRYVSLSAGPKLASELKSLKMQGNTPPSTGRRRVAEQSYSQEQTAAQASLPLTYSPQLAMQSMSRIQDGSKSSTDMPFTVPAQPKLVPTAIICAPLCLIRLSSVHIASLLQR